MIDNTTIASNKDTQNTSVLTDNQRGRATPISILNQSVLTSKDNSLIIQEKDPLLAQQTQPSTIHQVIKKIGNIMFYQLNHIFQQDTDSKEVKVNPVGKAIMCSELYPQFEKERAKLLGSYSSDHQHFAILYPILWVNRRDLGISIALKMFHETFSYVLPYFTKLLIINIRKTESVTWVGILIIMLNVFIFFAMGVLHENAKFYKNKVKAKSGQILRSIFYHKLKTANYRFLHDADASFISQIIFHEIERIQEFIGMIPICCSSPISFFVIYMFIFLEIEYRAWLPGTIFLILLLVTILMKIKNVKRKNLYSHMSSKRALVLNELIPNIKIVKVYSMESIFEKVLMKIRANEIKSLTVIQLLDSIIGFIDIMMPILCSATSVAYYNVSTGNVLKIEDTYVIVSVFIVSSVPFRAIGQAVDKYGYYQDSIQAFRLFLEKIIEKDEACQMGQSGVPENTPKSGKGAKCSQVYEAPARFTIRNFETELGYLNNPFSKNQGKGNTEGLGIGGKRGFKIESLDMVDDNTKFDVNQNRGDTSINKIKSIHPNIKINSKKSKEIKNPLESLKIFQENLAKRPNKIPGMKNITSAGGVPEELAINLSAANFYVDFQTSKDVLKLFFSKRFVSHSGQEGGSKIMKEMFTMVEQSTIEAEIENYSQKQENRVKSIKGAADVRLRHILKSITLQVSKGEKVCVLGGQGQGKTTFLYSLLKETVLGTGQMNLRGKVGFLSGRWPGIVNGTLRENIVLGARFNKKRYDKAIKAVCLDTDKFAGGDYVQLLNGASNLGFLDRKKMQMARNIYRKSDILVVDNFFDEFEGQEKMTLFKNFVKKAYKRRTILYLTDDLNLIKQSSNIIIFEEGKIVESGTYEALKEKECKHLKEYETLAKFNLIRKSEGWEGLDDDDSVSDQSSSLDEDTSEGISRVSHSNPLDFEDDMSISYSRDGEASQQGPSRYDPHAQRGLEEGDELSSSQRTIKKSIGVASSYQPSLRANRIKDKDTDTDKKKKRKKKKQDAQKIDDLGFLTPQVNKPMAIFKKTTKNRKKKFKKLSPRNEYSDRNIEENYDGDDDDNDSPFTSQLKFLEKQKEYPLHDDFEEEKEFDFPKIFLPKKSPKMGHHSSRNIKKISKNHKMSDRSIKIGSESRDSRKSSKKSKKKFKKKLIGEHSKSSFRHIHTPQIDNWDFNSDSKSPFSKNMSPIKNQKSPLNLDNIVLDNSPIQNMAQRPINGSRILRGIMTSNNKSSKSMRMVERNSNSPSLFGTSQNRVRRGSEFTPKSRNLDTTLQGLSKMLSQRSKGFKVDLTRINIRHSLTRGFLDIFLDTNIIFRLVIISMFIINGFALLVDDIWLGVWSAGSAGDLDYLRIYLIISCITAISVLLTDTVFMIVTRNGLWRVYRQVIHHLLKSDLEFLSRVPHNRIVYRLTRDLLIVDTELVTQIDQTVKAFFTMVGGIIVVLLVTFGIYSVIFILGTIFIARDFYRVLKVSARYAQVSSNLKSELYAILLTVAKSTLNLRNNNFREYFDKKFENASDNYQNVTSHLGNATSRWLGIRICWFTTFQIIGVYIFSMLAITIYPSHYIGKLWLLSFALVWVKKFRASCYIFGPAFTRSNFMMISYYRITEYMDRDAQRENKTKKVKLKDLKVDLKAPALQLKNVSFGYHLGVHVLKDVSLQVDSRERIALIGKPGSGKSTLIQILLKLYERKKVYKNRSRGQQETFRMFGQDIDQLNPFALRKKVSYLTGKPKLFYGTIRNNIDPHRKFSDQQIIKALHFLKFMDYKNAEDLEYLISLGLFGVDDKQLQSEDEEDNIDEFQSQSSYWSSSSDEEEDIAQISSPRRVRREKKRTTRRLKINPILSQALKGLMPAKGGSTLKPPAQMEQLPITNNNGPLTAAFGKMMRERARTFGKMNHNEREDFMNDLFGDHDEDTDSQGIIQEEEEPEDSLPMPSNRSRLSSKKNEVTEPTSNNLKNPSFKSKRGSLMPTGGLIGLLKKNKNVQHFKELLKNKIRKIDYQENEITHGTDIGPQEFKNYIFPKADEEIIRQVLNSKVGPGSPRSLTKLVNIARTFLEKPPLLFLEEEALSFEALDGMYFYNLFWGYFKDTTVVSLLQNFENLMRYDKVCIFDAGKLVEMGRPKLLLKDLRSQLSRFIKERDPLLFQKLHNTQESVNSKKEIEETFKKVNFERRRKRTRSRVETFQLLSKKMQGNRFKKGKDTKGNGGGWNFEKQF